MSALQKTLLIILMLATTPAIAEQVDDGDIRFPTIEAYGKATGDAVATYAEQQGYCAFKPPSKAKKGQIQIRWSRDSNGKCSIVNYHTVK